MFVRIWIVSLISVALAVPAFAQSQSSPNGLHTYQRLDGGTGAYEPYNAGTNYAPAPGQNSHAGGTAQTPRYGRGYGSNPNGYGRNYSGHQIAQLNSNAYGQSYNDGQSFNPAQISGWSTGNVG